MKRSALTIALLLATTAVSAAPWTYRGTLNDAGKPANGSYDLRVTLLNQAKTTSVYGPLTLYDVKVVNGNFAAELDFGTDLTAAPAMALKTEVQQGGSGFVSLGDATPFDPKSVLAGVCWDTEGNAGTNPATNFIGTTDANEFVIRADNVRALRIDPTTGAPNIIGGHTVNTANISAKGQTIAGGGDDAMTCGPDSGTTCRNETDEDYSTVSGGAGNRAVGESATVSGGYLNNAIATYSSVSGGSLNDALQIGSTVSGGVFNSALGSESTVSGGEFNSAIGSHSFVSGGYNSCAGAAYSWAGGFSAKVRPGSSASVTCPDYAAIGEVANSIDFVGDSGTFVWADGQFENFVSTGPNQFIVRAKGGVAINGAPPNADSEFTIYGRNGDALGGLVEFRLTPTPALNGNTGEGIEIGVSKGGAGGNDAGFRIAHRSNTLFADRFNLNSDGSVVIRSNTAGANTGVTMAANAGAWSSLSDRRLKQNIVPVNSLDVLDRVASLPMATWSYIAQGSGVRHIGPMAQDFAASFNVGENDTTISTIDADGVALAAIQGLNAKLDAQNTALRAQVEALLARVESLESSSNTHP